MGYSDAKMYEIDTKRNNINTDITLSSDGHIFEIEKTSNFSAMPLSAQAAIKSKYNILNISKIESVQLNYHEVKGTVNGLEVELKVYANGKITLKRDDED